MATTFSESKQSLRDGAQQRLDATVAEPQWTNRQKLALTCRVLSDGGHDAGLTGQITARAEAPDTYYTQRLGLGFDEITEDNLLVVDEDLTVVEGDGKIGRAHV